MNEPSDSYTQHRAQFVRVYDLDDPGPYFNAIGPADYRMPATLAGALKAMHGPLCAARGAGDTLRVLDFACGYGAIGALLRHDLSMAALYARYGARQWQPADARRYWADDIAFFAARRAETAAFDIGGIDIAGNAVAYAAALGFVDRAFPENLVDDAPSDGLARFLRGVHLVVESGALGVLLPAAFARVLDCAGDESPPWFLYCPRPDVNWSALESSGPNGDIARRVFWAPRSATASRWTRRRGRTCFVAPAGSASPTRPSCGAGTSWST